MLARDAILEYAKGRSPIPVRLSNAYCVSLASNDPSYAALTNGPGVTFPDGTPVVWFMRTKNRMAQTVRGPSLFTAVMEAGRSAGIQHFLLGTDDTTLSNLVTSLERKFPGVSIAGVHAPAFGPLDEAFYKEAVKLIQTANPDLIWIALGTPKQDFAAAELSKRTGLPCIAVGAAFDFVSGVTKEAPKWVQGTGIEWIYRFSQEPRRLWRRYTFGNLRFLYSAIVHSLCIRSHNPTKIERTA
ncbi:WecB/TagA/CpsF family glycosyltransferase [Rhodococcus opacus]|nr:WecB/TagA/CpsF family glycosyltransferase [Rhodococcus opacus]